MQPIISRRRFLATTGGLAALGSLGALGLSACGDDEEEGPAGTPAEGVAPSGEPIKIGGVFSLTGIFALFGELMRNGAILGVEKINEEGGVLGRPLELLVEDDGSTSTGAAERARKLLLDDKVDFVMGTLTSADSLAVVPVATEAKKPFFYILEGESKTCNPGGEGLNPYVFGIGSTPHQYITPFVPVLLERYGTDWYLIGSDYVFPRSVHAITKELLAQQGGRVVAEEYVPLGTTDFGPLIDKIAAAQPDLVFTYIVGPDSIAFTLRGVETGQLADIPVSGSAHFRPVQWPGLGQASIGTILVDHYSQAVDNPENNEFVARFRERFNFELPIDAIAADTYLTIQIIRAAAEQAGSIEPEAFIAAAEGLEVATPKGLVLIDPENHILQQNIYLLEITADGYKFLEDFGRQVHPDQVDCSVT